MLFPSSHKNVRNAIKDGLHMTDRGAEVRAASLARAMDGNAAQARILRAVADQQRGHMGPGPQGPELQGPPEL